MRLLADRLAIKTSKQLLFQHIRNKPPPLFIPRHFSDTIGGRTRFYKNVGVRSVGAPWEVIGNNNSSEGNNNETVDSPISAGVDGTQSASGVINTLPNNNNKDDMIIQQQKKMLNPRKPSLDWDETTTTNPNWYGITLDGRILKTPLGQSLSVPSELLAWAIAAEWDMQEKYLQPSQMPLMTLACTALDQTASAPDIIQEQALKYLLTDTICYWTDPMEDRGLHRRQQDAWDSIHNHCSATMFSDAKAAVAMGVDEALLMSRSRKTKQSGLPHPESVLAGAKKLVESLDAWHLTALDSVTRGSKSLLVALASLTGGADPKAAVEASRVEEEFQIANWGLVEGGHDYDRLNCSIQIHSAHIFLSSIAIDNKF